jgi:hypothetical protein
VLLPYCITDARFSGSASDGGVQTSAVESLAEGPLRCFYSLLDRLTDVSREDALAFHRVLTSIFRQIAVIPVRFPTLLEGEDALRDFLRKRGPEYSAALNRLRDSVQMELHISAAHKSAAASPASGKAYLEARRNAVQSLAAVAETAYGQVRQLTTGWRVRAGNRPDLLRCFALISRDAEKDFRHRIESLQASPAIKIVLSGPWPSSEFLE